MWYSYYKTWYSSDRKARDDKKVYFYKKVSMILHSFIETFIGVFIFCVPMKKKNKTKKKKNANNNNKKANIKRNKKKAKNPPKTNRKVKM